jgi:hypothetical protein
LERFCGSNKGIRKILQQQLEDLKGPAATTKRIIERSYSSNNKKIRQVRHQQQQGI